MSDSYPWGKEQTGDVKDGGTDSQSLESTKVRANKRGIDFRGGMRLSKNVETESVIEERRMMVKFQ